MKWSILVTAVALILAAWSTGCTAPSDETEVSLGQEVIVSPGQSAAVTGEALSVKFLEVQSDSRCPRNVVCVWAGEVRCLVEVTYFKSLHRLELIAPGLRDEPSQGGFREYRFTFQVDPYPEAGKDISPDDYRLRLTIDKSPRLSGGILVTFDVVGEIYRVFITNGDTINEVLAVQRGESRATIPSGRLVRGPVFYNEPWSWHIDPEGIHMAEATIELCDGTPSQVESNLDYWVDTVQSFCPWSARIVSIQDYR